MDRAHVSIVSKANSRGREARSWLDRVRELAKVALWRISESTFERVVAPVSGQRFSIGILSGASPFELQARNQRTNPVLSHTDVSDAPAAFVADPFMTEHDGSWYLFFEVMNRATHRGQIALATSRDCEQWTYQRTVLAEPFHLAYPHVFRNGPEIYLVPDSPGHGVRLYRATRFPYRWRLVDVLIEGDDWSDPTVFFANGRWWMYVACSPKGEGMSLKLFHSDSLHANWQEHPASPIVSGDDRLARPCGRIVHVDERLVRFAQDCQRCYGESVRALEVVRLSPTEYEEVEMFPNPVLRGAGAGWNADGMHHIDAHRRPDDSWVACVDGWVALGR